MAKSEEARAASEAYRKQAAAEYARRNPRRWGGKFLLTCPIWPLFKQMLDAGFVPTGTSATALSHTTTTTVPLEQIWSALIPAEATPNWAISFKHAFGRIVTCMCIKAVRGSVRAGVQQPAAYVFPDLYTLRQRYWSIHGSDQTPRATPTLATMQLAALAFAPSVRPKLAPGEPRRRWQTAAERDAKREAKAATKAAAKAAAKAARKAEAMAKRAAYDASPARKASMAAYYAVPENKAKAKARAMTPENKAKAKARRDCPEYKAKRAAYDASPARKASMAAHQAKRRARIRAAANATSPAP
jgi:hypothetical protein